MSPAKESTSTSRPKVSWDIRSVSWTDERVYQSDYATSVRLWCDFHHMLPATNYNKINTELRGMCHKSQLFGRARDVFLGIPLDTIKSSDGFSGIIDAIHKSEALSVVSEVRRDLNELRSTHRGQTESFRNYESRFVAQVAKFNANGGSIKFPESLTELMLLANFDAENAQPISVLAAETPSESSLSSNSSNEDFIKETCYSSM